MVTVGFAKPLPKCDFFFYFTTFYFLNICYIFINKLSILRTWCYGLCFAFCLSPQPPYSCRRRIDEVGFPPGSLSLEISIFRHRYF